MPTDTHTRGCWPPLLALSLPLSSLDPAVPSCAVYLCRPPCPQAGYLLGCGNPVQGGGDDRASVRGILQNHAYAIMQASDAVAHPCRLGNS